MHSTKYQCFVTKTQRFELDDINHESALDGYSRETIRPFKNVLWPM